MQFHLNGFRVGDPTIEPAADAAPCSDLPETVDVLIAGSGPAGLVLAAQLSQFPGIRTRIVERRSGPLLMGQADGVACRTVEMFNAFGLADRLLHEAYWVNETVFWRPDAHDRSRIARLLDDDLLGAARPDRIGNRSIGIVDQPVHGVAVETQ